LPTHLLNNTGISASLDDLRCVSNMGFLSNLGFWER